jgi:asparagine synthase (glutamine-hydrolysing)
LGFLAEERRAEVAEYDPVDDVRSRLSDGFQSRSWLSRAQGLEIGIFLSNYLLSSQGDRVAMAHSVEGRVPFLDHRLIHFAFRLPAKWKIRGLDEKHILKRLARRYLPTVVSDRPKQPYRAPIGEAFSSGARKMYFEGLLAPEALRQSGHFDPRKIELLFKRVERGNGVSEVQNMAATAIVTTELLQRRMIDGFPLATEPRVPDVVVRRGPPQVSQSPAKSGES